MWKFVEQATRRDGADVARVHVGHRRVTGGHDEFAAIADVAPRRSCVGCDVAARVAGPPRWAAGTMARRLRWRASNRSVLRVDGMGARSASLRRGPPRCVVGATRPLLQARFTFGLPAGEPLVQTLPGDPGLGGDMGFGTSAIDTQTRPALPLESQWGIAVRHEDLQGCGVVAFSSSTPRSEVLLISRSSILASHTHRVTNLREWDT
jgi:hypothetical protein